MQDADRQSVAFAHAIDLYVGFVRQASGIERQDLDRQRMPRDQVDQHHVLGAEAAGQRCRRMVARDAGQQRDDVGDAGFDGHRLELSLDAGDSAAAA